MWRGYLRKSLSPFGRANYWSGIRRRSADRARIIYYDQILANSVKPRIFLLSGRFVAHIRACSLDLLYVVLNAAQGFGGAIPVASLENAAGAILPLPLVTNFSSTCFNKRWYECRWQLEADHKIDEWHGRLCTRASGAKQNINTNEGRNNPVSRKNRRLRVLDVASFWRIENWTRRRALGYWRSQEWNLPCCRSLVAEGWFGQGNRSFHA